MTLRRQRIRLSNEFEVFPMMILDPQNDRDVFPVTDQNEWLAKDHPDLVIHRAYAQSAHDILQSRPDWLVRDAAALLDRVRKPPR